MKKIMNKLFTWISTNMDKLCHVSFSIILTAILSIILFRTTNNCTILLASLSGLFLTMCIGLIKEVIDFFRGQEIDIKDLIADFIGAIIGAILYALFSL